MSTTLIICFWLCYVPNTFIVEDRVDIIEFNDLYDDMGRQVFQQVIFYQFNTVVDSFVVMDWRLLNFNYILIKTNNTRFCYTMRFYDINRGVERKIYSHIVKYTKTNFDPELLNREIWPQEIRIPLGKPFKSRNKKR